MAELVIRDMTREDEYFVGTCSHATRAIFVNGKEIGWGYEAPRNGLRETISKAIEQSGVQSGHRRKNES
ncbi:hypothetical protein ACFLU6_07050 [Acidobacteriota bacterium]